MGRVSGLSLMSALTPQADVSSTAQKRQSAPNTSNHSRIGQVQHQGTLSGEVEVDGAYFGDDVKPANERKDRKDRRKRANHSGKRQSVIIMRERGGSTKTVVAATEANAVDRISQNVAQGSSVHADEVSHWDKLEARYRIKMISHQEAYSKDGACTNQAESFSSRLRRSEIGIHYHIAGK